MNEMAGKKRDLLWLHITITVVIMFGFQYLPPIEPITPLGMNLLGIFIGLVYAWSTTSMIWPSLLGMVAILFSDVVPLKTFLADGFGNETVVFVLFIFVFAAIIDEAGATSYLTSWFLSRKWIAGHPWRLVFLILVASYFASAAASIFATIVILWSIVYNICGRFGYKPYDKFPTLMLIGIPLVAVMGGCLFPFKVTPMVFMGAYKALTGMTIDYFKFVCFTFPMGFVTILVYMFVCKFIFKLDLSPLKSISNDLIPAEELILNKKQKIVFTLLAAFMILSLLPGLLPKTFILAQILSKIEATGILLIILVIMLWIRIDGKPLYDFKKMSSGIVWDMLLLFIVVFPLSSYLVADGTGIKLFLVNTISPLVQDKPLIIFILVMTVVPTLLTNVANNAVVALVFLPVLFSVSESIGVNPTPIAMTLVFLCTLAFMTPAASVQAAMLFGNVEWLRAKDIYRYVAVSLFFLMVVYIVLGLSWGSVLF